MRPHWYRAPDTDPDYLITDEDEVNAQIADWLGENSGILQDGGNGDGIDLALRLAPYIQKR